MPPHHHHHHCHCHGPHGFGDGEAHHFGPCIPLSMIGPEERARVIGIRGGPGIRRRLAELGLNVGAGVRVVHTDTSGQLIVSVKEDARLAVGRELAHRVMVEPMREEDC